jgi:hypothetical protein
VGGNPGAVFAENSPSRLVMGGGGGAGDNNNETGTFGAFSASGASGGGIVIISAGTIVNAGTIDVSGMAADSSENYDGVGGGGAGGSVLLHAGSGHSNITVYANGGNGGINDGDYFGLHYAHGPGGGGGGGVVHADGAPGAVFTNGGLAGRTTDDILGVTNFGAAPGAAGLVNTSAFIPPPLSCALLPMKFVSVYGLMNGAQVLVGWQVANEKNIAAYTIERSSNAADFFSAGTIGYKKSHDDINR